MILQGGEPRLYARGPIMSMSHAMLDSLPLPSPSQIADLRLAASKMTGPQRRAFEAEMTLKYCGGNPLMAEAVFGWGRQTVALGLAERRTGIMCLGALKSALQWPQTLGRAAAAGSPSASSTRRCPGATRPNVSHEFDLHAADGQSGLEGAGANRGIVRTLPSPSTMAEVLNRMGFRLRKVVKAKPQKEDQRDRRHLRQY